MFRLHRIFKVDSRALVEISVLEDGPSVVGPGALVGWSLFASFVLLLVPGASLAISGSIRDENPAFCEHTSSYLFCRFFGDVSCKCSSLSVA